MDKSRIFLIIWTVVLLLVLANNNTAPKALTPEALTAFEAAQPATGALTPGDPITVSNENLKVKIDPDGSLVSAIVQRYDEEIVHRKMVPDEIVRDWSDKKLTTAPPVYSAGVHVAKPPLFLTDDRRKRLGTSSEKTAHGGDFANVDTEGKALPRGLSVEKRWTLDEKRFVLDLEIVLKNTTQDLLDLSKSPPLHVFAGPMLAGDRVQPQVIVSENGVVAKATAAATATECTTGVSWIGVRNNYYAFILDRVKGAGRFVHQNVSFRELEGKQRTAPVVGFKMDVPFIKKGESVSYKFKLYVGPKTEADLGAEYVKAFDNWDGWIGFISHLMFWVLQFFHGITGSYGFAVLMLTLCVKLMLHPLSFTQTENMQRMQAIQPRIQEIKERYKDNPEQMQAETMKLWKEHNYNPAGGCLPMFMQIPIFISLYNSLQYAIELKGVGFWWMPDLSKPDPTTLLALLFALSVYFNGKVMAQKQSQAATAAPAGADQDMQVVMNRMMPIMMYGMFVMMPVPGGVMIYLATQSLLGLVETRYNMMKLKKKAGKRSKA